MAVLVIFRANGDPADLLSRYERTLAVRLPWLPLAPKLTSVSRRSPG
jgi:hypothetical protein